MLSTNPWNIVYKSAAEKTGNNQMSALQKTNGTHTDGLLETLQCALQYLTPKDDKSEKTSTINK